MKKQAEKLKKGDKINLGGEIVEILKIELSDIGKHGKKKCRLEVKMKNGEKLVIIRPSDFVFDVV